jgi:magnesium chelatase subunit I
MSEQPSPPSAHSEPGEPAPVGSLRELIDIVTGRAFKDQVETEDAGLAEVIPFPFLALVGQEEMKLALIISVINPLVNGVLLVGPRGTGKTTIVRSLVDLLPSVQRSACYYGCLPEDIETGGLDAVCPDCARKYGMGQPLTRTEQGRLIELPLNSRLEDVIGGWDERALAHNRPILKSGILKQADMNVLYIDEVNLLSDEIVNAILDASAQGTYTVRRGPVSSTYRSRFTLIGSMNPEEGRLRSQIMDRFGLRVIVQGLKDADERIEAYHRSRAYRLNPRAVVTQFSDSTSLARGEIEAARALLPQVSNPREVELAATHLIQRMGIDSLRAEITLLEAARAHAAADGRKETTLSDLRIIAPMALRLRQSPFMIKYFTEQNAAEDHLSNILDEVIPPLEGGRDDGETSAQSAAERDDSGA